ncbi:PKD domain-containing protein [Sanyastnella coralliicola]|uniref:PKD domain-containing protein n=1 Tax=Sanyastnella coralliicola TaxID=3069118 RepID=UPI0027BA4C43|nr:PKD domain-containing protein [Longitalea sp. SCSIO 12813]
MFRRLTILVLAVVACLEVSAQVSFSVNEAEGCSPLPVIISVDTPDPNTVSTFNWVITYPDNSTVTSSSSQYIDILSEPGTYDVTLTIDGVETTTIQDFITVHAPPVADLAVDDTAGCAPHCVQYTDATLVTDGAIVEWSWDFGNGITSNEQNPAYCYDAAGTFSPVLSVEDEFGCFSSISVDGMISVSDDYPVAEFTPSTFSDCNPPVSIDFTNTSSGNGLNCEWDFDDGFTQTTVDVTDISHSFDNVGSYDVCLTVEDAIGCVVTACETIEIVQAPTPSFDISENLLCAGGTVIFTDTSNPAPSGWSWDFDGDGIEDSTDSIATFIFDQPGIFNPVLTAVYSDNCVGSTDGSVSIEVLNPINIDFTADDAASCVAPHEVNITNNSTGQNLIGYEWLIDGVSVSTDNDLNYTFDMFGSYDVGLVVNTSSCSDTLIVVDYIVVEPPTISFENPDVICTGEPVILTNIEIESVEAVIETLWDFDNDGVPDASGDAPVYAYAEPGEYTIEVFLTTVSGCTSTIAAEETILVQPNVVSEFTADNPISCAGEPITFCTDMVENTAYSWNFGDNTGWQTASFPDSCIVHDYADTGYFDVTLSVYNLACNALLLLEDYIYIPPPIAEFSFTQDCADLNTVTFLDESIEADSLIWDFGDGSPLVYNDTNPTHTYPGPGTYVVELVVFNDDTGCYDDRTQAVITTTDPINLSATNAAGCAPLVPNFATTDYTIYQNFFVDFGNGVTMEATLNENNIWDVYTTTPDGVDYANYSFTVNFFPDVEYNTGGLYDVTITGTDVSGCSYTTVYDDMVNVFNDLIFADFNTTIVEGCDSVLISFEPTGNFLDTYTWEFTDGTTSNDLNPVHQFFAPWDTTFGATFTATDDFGCGSVVTHVVDLVPPPIPDFTITVDPSCIGDTITLTNSSVGDIIGYSWDFGNPGDPNNTSTEENPQHVYLQNGSYDVCLTAENSQGCQQTQCQANVVNIVSPVADFTFTSDNNNCLFGVQFENTTTGVVQTSQWDFGDNQVGSGNSPFHTYPIGVFDVELVVSNQYGCYDTTMVEDIFNLSNVIGPYEVTLDPVSCAPFQVSFDAYNTNDQSFTYFWEFGDGFGDPDNNTSTSHTYLDPGTYCPSLVMEDANGCPFLIECEQEIVVEEFTFDVSAIDPICFGDSTMIEFTGADSYTIDQPELFTPIGGDEYWLTAPVSTEIIVTGFFEDCQYENTVDLVINQLPLVELAMVEEICYNEPSFPLDGGLPVGNTGVYTVNGMESTEFDPSMPDNASYEVIYTYTDDNQCVNTDTADVFIHPLPVVTLDTPDPMCEAEVAVGVSGGAPAGGTYYVDGVEITEFDPAVYPGIGDYEVEYIYTDANGCVEDDFADLTINAQPQASFDPPSICWLESINVQSTSTIEEGTIDEFIWDIEQNGQITGTSAPDITVDGPGVIDISLTVVSDQGCSTSYTDSLIVYATPVADVNLTDICADESIVLDNQSSTDAQEIIVWDWTVNGEPHSNQQDPVGYDPASWGNYEIELYVETDAGCSDVFTQDVFVNPLPVINVQFDNACEGSEVTFTNTSSIPATTIDYYAWNNGLGDPIIADQSLMQTYDNAGDYVITLEMGSSAGCVVDTTMTLTIHPNPVAAFGSSGIQACANASVELEDLSTISGGDIINWEWLVNGETFANGQEAVFATDEPGEYDISLVVISDQGCVNGITEPGLLEIWPAPTADFSYTPDEPDTSTPFIIVTDQSEGVTEWNYTTSDGGFYTSPDFEHTFPGAGEYDLTLVTTNWFGCTDSLTVTITVDPTLIVYVPNAFTPDSDGINEIFQPVISGSAIDEYKFFIFDRWGDVVFETEDPSAGWIGNRQGGEYFVPDGVYPWRIEIASRESGEREIYTGHVTLLR